MKLFTKEIDNALFAQYKKKEEYALKGEEMPEDEELVICKIFNPYGRGVWYITDSDPTDPDYLWGLVNLFEVEMGSISRNDLVSIKVPPFRLGLERDMSWTPKPVNEVYRGLNSGEYFEDGGPLSGERVNVDTDLGGFYLVRVWDDKGLETLSRHKLKSDAEEIKNMMETGATFADIKDKIKEQAAKGNVSVIEIGKKQILADGGEIEKDIYKEGGLVKYFDNALESAQKKYDEYHSSTKDQKEHLGFLGAGNMSKASSNRFQTIKGKQGDLLIDIGRRKTFKLMYDTKIYSSSYEFKGQRINWAGLNEILEQCARNAFWNDETDYQSQWFATNLNSKLEAITAFIERYGSSTDKKYLLPKFDVKNSENTKYADGGMITSAMDETANVDVNGHKYNVKVKYSKQHNSTTINVEDQGPLPYGWTIQGMPIEVIQQLYKMLGKIVGNRGGDTDMLEEGDLVKMFEDEPLLIINGINSFSDKTTYDLISTDGSFVRKNISANKFTKISNRKLAKGGLIKKKKVADGIIYPFETSEDRAILDMFISEAELVRKLESRQNQLTNYKGILESIYKLKLASPKNNKTKQTYKDTIDELNEVNKAIDKLKSKFAHGGQTTVMLTMGGSNALKNAINKGTGLKLHKFKQGGKVESNEKIILAQFIDVIKNSDSEQDAFNIIRQIKNVPSETANYFSEKYNPDDNLSMEKAFSKFYNKYKPKNISNNKMFNIYNVSSEKEEIKNASEEEVKQFCKKHFAKHYASIGFLDYQDFASWTVCETYLEQNGFLLTEE